MLWRSWNLYIRPDNSDFAICEYLAKKSDCVDKGDFVEDIACADPINEDKPVPHIFGVLEKDGKGQPTQLRMGLRSPQDVGGSPSGCSVQFLCFNRTLSLRASGSNEKHVRRQVSITTFAWEV